jgi:hypothetical protein
MLHRAFRPADLPRDGSKSLPMQSCGFVIKPGRSVKPERLTERTDTSRQRNGRMVRLRPLPFGGAAKWTGVKAITETGTELVRTAVLRIDLIQHKEECSAGSRD